MLLFDDNVIADNCDAQPPAQFVRSFDYTSTLNVDNVVGTSTFDTYDESTTTRLCTSTSTTQLDYYLIDDNGSQNCTGTSSDPSDLEILQQDLIQWSYFDRYQRDESEIAKVLCAIADSTGTKASI
jgi:hypothetical protein